MQPGGRHLELEVDWKCISNWIYFYRLPCHRAQLFLAWLHTQQLAQATPALGPASDDASESDAVHKHCANALDRKHIDNDSDTSTAPSFEPSLECASSQVLNLGALRRSSTARPRFRPVEHQGNRCGQDALQALDLQDARGTLSEVLSGLFGLQRAKKADDSSVDGHSLLGHVIKFSV